MGLSSSSLSIGTSTDEYVTALEAEQLFLLLEEEASFDTEEPGVHQGVGGYEWRPSSHADRKSVV